MIKRLIDKIKRLLALKCPDCGGVMRSEFYDMEIDELVYKCEQCGKQWI